MSFHTRSILSLLIIVLGISYPSRISAGISDHRPILIVCSYNPAAHQTSIAISDYMEGYRKLGGKRDIVIENLNCKSFAEASRWSNALKQILSKYSEKTLPIQIILFGQEAWAAYLSVRDSIPVKVPIMCSLVSNNVVVLPKDSTALLDTWMPESLDFLSGDIKVPELRAGFMNQYDIDGNIRMIKSFYPNTRHIVFISDNTYGGVTMQALVRKEMRKYPDLELDLLDGRRHTIYTIVDELRSLPKNSVVLIGTWRIDKNEGYFMRNATYTMMEANPTVPVFTPSSVGLGYWAIGGVIPDYTRLGEDMAKASINIDKHPEDTTTHLNMIKSKAVLDSEKVKELQLDVHALPFGVTLVNQPVSFYEQYTYQIWAAMIAFAALTLGLFVSLFYYIRTKRLKDRLLDSDKELRIAKDRAEESNRLKSAFLANMSHEIRTPLNSIVGFSEVLTAEGSTMEEQRLYSRIIQTNSEMLLRLINDILDLSRLEANRVTLNWEACDVIQICEQVISLISVSHQTGNRFLFTSQYTEFLMSTDVQRLQQVLINLLSNADKFTENGTVTLEFAITDEKAVFSVTDTGCGIPKEKHRQVFERFEKLNEYAPGTGLGLSICQLLVHKWHGEIWIDEAYTGGARFMFSHPLSAEKPGIN